MSEPRSITVEGKRFSFSDAVRAPFYLDAPLPLQFPFMFGAWSSWLKWWEFYEDIESLEYVLRFIRKEKPHV